MSAVAFWKSILGSDLIRYVACLTLHLLSPLFVPGQNEGDTLPVVLCGDLNSTPDTDVYK